MEHKENKLQNKIPCYQKRMRGDDDYDSDDDDDDDDDGGDGLFGFSNSTSNRRYQDKIGIDERLRSMEEDGWMY